MLKGKKLTQKAAKTLASIALKTGIASTNSVCRAGFHQNKVPTAMNQFKKK